MTDFDDFIPGEVDFPGVEKEINTFGHFMVDRYTIERLDPEHDVVRLEKVRSRVSLQEVEKNIDKASSDDLNWWDDDQVEEETRSLTEFIMFMKGIKPDQDGNVTESQALQIKQFKEQLEENMVFWLLIDNDQVVRAYNATALARNLSKELYNHLLKAPRKSGGEEPGGR